MLEILGLVMLLERLLSGEGKLYGNSFIFYIFKKKEKKKKVPFWEQIRLLLDPGTS